MSSRVESSSTRRRASSPSPVVIACSSAVTRSRSVHAPPCRFHLREPCEVFLGAPARGLGRDLEVALGDALRFLGAGLRAQRHRLRFLLLAQAARVLVEQAVVVEERSAHPVELVDDPGVLVVHALDLGGELRPRLVRRREPGLRGALLFGGAQALDLAPQGRRGALGVGASRGLFFEQLAFLEGDPARFFGGAQVVASERLDLGQPLAGAPPARDRRASTAAGSTVSTGAGGSGGRARSASISSRSSLRVRPASEVPRSEVATGSVGGAIRLILRRRDPPHLTTLRDISSGYYRRSRASASWAIDATWMPSRSNTRAKASPRPSATPPPRSS